MTHAAVVWRDTVGETATYGAADSRTLSFSFYGYWKYTGASPGLTPPPDVVAAISAAETDGANLRIDGRYAGPSGTTVASGIWILSSMTVERLDDTNAQSDVVWIFRVRLELADTASGDEPFVQTTTQASAVNVSAFRVNPTVPTDMTTPASDEYLASNNTIWHGTTDIGGVKVDWSGQPIQYALPIRTTSMTIYRPAPIWTTTGTRDVGAITQVTNDSALIGYRNSEDMGWIGDVGEVLLASVQSAPSGNGLYAITYQFRWHPWKHAIEVPYTIGGQFAPTQNTDNVTRSHNTNIWWSQPHLLGADFLGELSITSDEWKAVGITVSC